MPPPIDPGYRSPTLIEPIEVSVYILKAGFSVATPDAREGMGFIIGEHHILTCAHVVASALGASGDLKGRRVSFSYSPLNLRSTVVEATVEGYWPRDDSARKGDPPSDVALLRVVDANWTHPYDSVIAPWGVGVAYDMGVRGYGISDTVRSGRDFQGPVSGEGAGMRWRISSHADPNRKIVPGCSGGAVWVGTRVIGMVTSFQQEEVGLFIPAEFLVAQPEIRAVWTDGGGDRKSVV